MDRSTPEQPDPPAPHPSSPPRSSPLPSSEVAPTPGSTAGPASRTEARLEALAGAPVVAWARGWVSREQRLHRLLAARTLDVAVLTGDKLVLVSTGFFTRRPRRRVYQGALDRIAAVDAGARRGRRLLVTSDTGTRLRIELRANARAEAFADALIGAAGESTGGTES